MYYTLDNMQTETTKIALGVKI